MSGKDVSNMGTTFEASLGRIDMTKREYDMIIAVLSLVQTDDAKKAVTMLQQTWAEAAPSATTHDKEST